MSLFSYPLETILFFVIPNFLLFFFMFKYKETWKTHKNTVRFTYLIILTINAITRWHKYIYIGDFTFASYFLVPQYYCDFTYIVLSYFLITEDKRVMPFLALAGFIGSVAFLIPETFGFGNYSSAIEVIAKLNYVFDHLIYLSSGFMFLIVYDYEPSKNGFINVLIVNSIIILLYALPLVLHNFGSGNQLDQDFLFLGSKPVLPDLNLYIYAIFMTIGMSLYMGLGQFIHVKVKEKL